MNTKTSIYKMIFLLALFVMTTLISRIGLPFILALVLENNDLNSFSQILLGQIVAFVIPLIIFLKFTKCDSSVSFRKTSIYLIPISCKKLAIFYIISLSLVYYLIIISGLNAIYLIIYAIDPSASLIQTPSEPSFFCFLILCLIFGVIPAFIEEIIYRGIAFDAFIDKGILLFIIPTIMFALSHENIFSIFSAFFLGVLLMKTMYLTRNLLEVIIFHLLYNVYSLIFSNYIILPYSVTYISGFAFNSLSIAGIALEFISISLFLLLLFCYLWSRFRKHHDITVKDVMVQSYKISVAEILILICIVAFSVTSFLIL